MPSRKVLHFLIYGSIPLASFLSFSIQSIVGKSLIPLQGGTAATWMGTSIFFQLALLLGYSSAYGILKTSFHRQLIIWLILGLLAAITLQLPLRPLDVPGVLGTFLILAVSMLPAALVLFGTSILLHGWLWRYQANVPYALYALSNIGSLGGLVAYPFLIEPYTNLSDQFWFWKLGFFVFVALQLGLIVAIKKTPATRPQQESDEEPGENLPASRFVSWLVLAALPCVAMLGTIQLVSAEIGSNPLVWVIPLGVYLGSFSLTFAGWWRPVFNQIAAIVCIVAWVGLSLTRGMENAALSGWPLIWLLLALTGACLAGHGLLYTLRPARDFGKFYLCLAFGGALGGVYANLLAPNLLSTNSEAWWALTLLSLIFAVYSCRGPLLPKLTCAAPILALLCAVAFVSEPLPSGTRKYSLRNEYGTITVELTPQTFNLSHESTVHGIQVVSNAEQSRQPTAYYTHSSGVGTALLHLQKQRPAMRVGVIGLGAGTLAAYAREGDEFIFWDIDPKVNRIAQTVFTYLKNSEGSWEIRMADGRRGLAESTEAFDLIVVDAFSGDAIPPHLLTLEALAIYRDRVKERDGLIAIHMTNRYADLHPVVATTANELGLECLFIGNAMKGSGHPGDLLSATTKYTLLHDPALRTELNALFIETEESSQIRTRMVSRLSLPHPAGKIWTDDRHAVLDVLDVRSIFKKSG